MTAAASRSREDQLGARELGLERERALVDFPDFQLVSAYAMLDQRLSLHQRVGIVLAIDTEDRQSFPNGEATG